MPNGLYKDVITTRIKFHYLFHVASYTRWAMMIAQLFIGAALTALGSMSRLDGTPITILGAANTVIAGILALLHNSGLPDRYRYDMNQFEEVEDYIRELLDAGIVPADATIGQVVAHCFELVREAKLTVAENLPSKYSPSQGNKNSKSGQNGASDPSPLSNRQSTREGVQSLHVQTVEKPAIGKTS